MDVLSDLLDSAGLRGQVYCRTLASAPWGLEMPPLPQVGLHVVTEGVCWVRLAGEDELHRLLPGDAVILPHGSGHSLSDAPESPLLSFDEWKESKDERHRLIRRSGGGGEATSLICGGYRFVSGSAHPLVQLLPSRITARSVDGSGLDLALRSLRREFERPDVGSPTIMSRLLDVVFVEILRQWLDTQGDGESGWLGALRDAAVSDALARLHQEPARRWTVADLAREVGLSRSVLARRFREKVGQTPLAYLAQVRLELAARQLLTSEASLIEIARRVGYDSEFAFNRAFKRQYGRPPGRFRRAGAGVDTGAIDEPAGAEYSG